ncbi:MAG: glycosyltransferase family 4 protein [Planctomycetota bacterium]|nr:glycosyltransferase family 4 protein [Planctomycetota bacterium]
MNLLMVSGDRQVAVGERGPFWAMLRHFSTFFERVDVLVPPQPGEVTTLRLHDNVHLHPAPVKRSGMASWIDRLGGELVREHGHGLVVSHDYGTFYNGRGAARLSRRTGIPFVSELHHIPGHPVAADARERLEKLMARTYVRWARRRVAAFRVVNGTEMPELLASWGVPEEKVVVLPSQYLDFEIFHPPRRELALERDVVFVGRLVANKCVGRILDALALLAGRGKERRATIVGKGPEKEGLVAKATTLGLADRVEWIEWVDSPEELAEIYRASRVCVCASTCEGGPRFTVEAMACGTPVVSTPVGVMTDLLKDGEAGRLAGFDVESLASALEDVLTHEGRRRDRGAEAIRRVQPYEYHAALERYARGLITIAEESACGSSS